ncbi:MAG: class I SAM-dependent methyltransferase [Bacteroidota bacterium]|jgi:SAM-dependent methyltransferase
MQSTWFKDWFSSEEYNLVYLHRDDNDAKKLINLIISTIDLNKNHLLLDAACGNGRHLNYLLSLGYHTVGFDLSFPFLIQAKNNSLKYGFNPLLIQADIRNIFFKNKFDAVLNLFTSFGYFTSDEENFSFAKNALSFLKKDGFFILDYLNKDYLIKNLIPSSQREVNGYKVKESREINNERVIKKIEITKGEQSKCFYESVKLYSMDFILEHFFRFGYSLISLFGNYNGNQFNNNISERLIAIFKK